MHTAGSSRQRARRFGGNSIGNRVWWFARLGLAVSLSGCSGGDGSGGCGYGGCNGAPLMPTIESIQSHVFTPRCATCHSGANAPLGLSLETAQTSYNNLVGVTSVEDPSLLRVEPGDPDNSYLVRKIEGTQTVGERMPRGQPPLAPATIAVIREWIANGAAPPGSAAKSESLFLPADELSPEPVQEPTP